MKTAHVGLGKMGKAVELNAVKRGHTSVSQIDRQTEISVDTLKDADIVFECTLPDVAVENILKIVDAKKDCVVATTAWHNDPKNLEKVQNAVEKNGTRLIYSNNFSLGAAAYEKIIEFSGKIFNKLEDYDVWGHEIHHRNKVESPSGTAKNLEKILLGTLDRKTAVVEEALLSRKPEEYELHFSSTRAGYNNFKHTVGFDSEAQVIEISHTSKTRDAFSIDTVKAGEWLLNQKPGIYTMKDFVESML